jgi:hypothetical protein
VFERSRFAKITDDEFPGEMLEVVATTGRPNQQAEIGTCGGQGLRDVAADESGGACEEDSQSRFSPPASPFSVGSSFIFKRFSVLGSQFFNWYIVLGSSK